jgi:hypothetical protein
MARQLRPLRYDPGDGRPFPAILGDIDALLISVPPVTDPSGVSINPASVLSHLQNAGAADGIGGEWRSQWLTHPRLGLSVSKRRAMPLFTAGSG